MMKELTSQPNFVDESGVPETGKAPTEIDDDGRPKRTGTLLTASAHIIAAVIGSGVLSLAWATAQLGWVVGPVTLLAFSIITWFCSSLLADCYRSPHPVHGKRNYTYRSAVRANLGGMKYRFCGLAQYTNLVGVSIGYAVTTATSMKAVRQCNCYHKNGRDAACEASTDTDFIIFASIEMVLSQIPDLHNLWGLSILAAIMSFAYSSIGLGLCIAKIAGGGHVRTSLTGVAVGVDVTASEKVWRVFQALGNMAFAYTYANVLIEIQDTLKPSPPENKVMKRASCMAVSITTVFYMLCGVLGYAALGNHAPGNFLTDFGFYEPYWLIDIGNICVVIHLIGAYQVMCQPIFQCVEEWCHNRWPDNGFLTAKFVVRIPLLGDQPFSVFRLIWRSLYIIVVSLIAMIFHFFNGVLGLIGALTYWPLTLYFPIEMYIAQAKVRKFSATWTSLKMLSFGCLVVSLIAACASVQKLILDLKSYKPFSNS